MRSIYQLQNAKQLALHKGDNSQYLSSLSHFYSLHFTLYFLYVSDDLTFLTSYMFTNHACHVVLPTDPSNQSYSFYFHSTIYESILEQDKKLVMFSLSGI